MTVKELLEKRATDLETANSIFDGLKTAIKNLSPELSVAQNKAMSDALFVMGLTDHPIGSLNQWIDSTLVKSTQKAANIRALVAQLPAFTQDQEDTFFKVVIEVVLRGRL